MPPPKTEPISQDWTINECEPRHDDRLHATAAAVNERLAQLEVVEIGERLVPFLAAAAAEMALGCGISWRFAADDPPVALLRLIAKVGIGHPEAGGIHTDRLLAQLQASSGASTPSIR